VTKAGRDEKAIAAAEGFTESAAATKVDSSAMVATMQ
jgi:hypothetical protein